MSTSNCITHQEIAKVLHADGSSYKMGTLVYGTYEEIEAWCDVPTRAIRLRDDVKYQDPEDIEQIGEWIHVAEKSHKQTKSNGKGG